MFNINAPPPSFVINLIASSALVYQAGNSLLSIPALSLWPRGKDRSKIRCHVLALFFLGITPKRLTCTVGNGGVFNRPETRPAWISVVT